MDSIKEIAMNKFDKQINNAAIIECANCNKVLKEEPLTSDVQWDEIDFSVGYNYGVKSNIAKEYWQKGLYTEEELMDLMDEFSWRLDKRITFKEWIKENKKK